MATDKKKKKEFSFEEWSNANHAISKEQEEEDARKRQAYLAQQSDDIAPVREDLREATWGDALWNSFSRGYQNSEYGTETFKKMTGQANEADVAKAILEQDKYQFEAQGFAKKAVSGAMEMLGQQWYNLNDPETKALMVGGGATGAGMAALAGQAGPQIALPEELLTVPAGFLTGVGAGYAAGSAANALEIEAGLAYNEMIEMGISEGTAKAIALCVGGVNAGLEMLQLDELLKAFKVANKAGATDSVFKVIMKELAERGVDVAKETAQEVAQEGVTIAGTQIGSKLDTGEWAYDAGEVGSRLGETAVSSMLTFGAMNVPATVTNIATSGNRVSGTTEYTAEEKAVIDKVFNDAVAEAESDGKKLTKSEKTKLHASIVEQMEKGQIDTDTIDSMFGGEEYKAYKDTVTREDALRAEYEGLGSLEHPTLAQQTRYKELHENRDTFINDDMRNDLRKKLDDKLAPALKNSKLAESYREEARSHQKFKADSAQYKDENARQTIQNLVDSGLLNDTRETHEVVDWLAQIATDKGVTFGVKNAEMLKGTRYEHKGRTTNAYFNEETGKVTLNIDSEKPLNSSVGHELGHVLKGIDENLYEEFKAEFKKWANNKNGEWDARYKTTAETYAKRDADGNIIRDADGNIVYINNSVNIDDEVLNDLIGDYIFTDKDFVKHLSVKQPNVFKRIWDEIKYMVKVAKAGTKVEKDLLALEKQFAEIWRETGKYQPKKAEATQQAQNTAESVAEQEDPAENTDFSLIGETKDGRRCYESGFGEDVSMDERIEIFKERIATIFNLGAVELKTDVKKIQVRGDKFTSKENLYGDKMGQSGEMGAKINALYDLADILATSKYAPSETIKEPSYENPSVKPKNKAHKGVKYWYKFKNEIVFDGVPYTVTFNIRDKGGEQYQYLIDFKENKTPGLNNTAVKSLLQADRASYGKSIAPIPENVNTDFSLSSDSDGNHGNEDVKLLDGDTAVKFSISTWTPETQDKVRKNLTKAGYEADRVDKWIDDLNGVAAVIAANKDRLDFEAADNQVMLKNNQEYVKTLDASTLCAKRLKYQGTFNAIQHRLPNTVLTSDDLIELQNMMKEHGHEAPCSVCYVESRRRHLGKFAQEWLDGYEGEYKPRLDEVTTSDGLEALRHSHPQTYQDFVDAMNAKGSANPKVVQLRTAYRNDIMALTKKQVEKIEAIGGLRIQSFSDFETPHLLDMMQAVMDMSAKGLTSQAYTKVPNFAWVFGDTGIKINLSLIAEGNGFDSEGNLAFSSVEGMDINEAMAVRDAYPANVGTIIVGANDAHILACMADDRIDYIIPFHRSGWGKNEMDMMGLGSYEDYSYGQNEHDLETGKKVANLYPPDYWDYNVSGKENAERYLKLCAQTGREPKFSQFLVNNGDGSYSLQPDGSTDGYWKTLIDFKMYDNEGNGVKQQKVQPNFNMEEAYRVLSEYEGGANSLPVANDVVEEFVAKHSDDIAPTSDVQHSISNESEEFAPIGDFAVYGKDIKYTPQEDIAPVSTNTPTAQANTPTVGETIGEKPAVPTSERIADGRRSDELLLDSLDNHPVQTIEQKIEEKIRALRGEINDKKDLRREAWDDRESQIAELRAKYNSKKNKNTKEARGILESISRKERLKASDDADFAERISALEARVEKMSKPEYKTAMQRKQKHSEYDALMEELVGDTSTWKDKKLGILYKINTLRRNLRDIVRDANGEQDIAKADAIYDELQGKYNHNEAELKRESARLKSVFREMKLTHAEDTYAHMLGELRHNPETTLTEKDVNDFYEKHKSKIDAAKVDRAIDESRKVFDELIVRVNERLREQGMKEIPYRQGYFPHFKNPKQGFLAKLLNWKTVDTEIPTSIAGLTETFNPERSYQSFDKRRKVDDTDYSLEKGLDTYIHGALDWIYHIEDIQKRRALENYIRYTHSEEGIKAKIQEIRDNDSYDADEAQRQIDAAYAVANNPLNNFVTNLRAGTNTLANKKSENDRQIESDTNRKIYSVMTNLNNRVSANMVVGSLSASLTNLIPITQSWVEVSPVNTLLGMRDTIKATIRDDGIVMKSDFLTNRLMNEENLYKTGWDYAADGASFIAEAIDSFTAQTIWRSKYIQNISEGMSEAAALKNADQFAENVIAGRSRGNMPTIFDAKNPVTKIFTAFQLEVANQYGYLFKDAPIDAKNKARLTKGYAVAFMGAWVYNALYSSLVGRDAAFDPISIIEDLFKDLFDDEEEEEKIGKEEVIEAGLNLVGNIADELPFIGGLLGGGRIPISSAIPYGGDFESFIRDAANAELSVKEMLKPVYYFAMPFGGGQIKKLNEGLGMFSDDHPVTGSYTDSGKLRFPVEKTPLNVAQAALFGQYASKNARTYFDNDYAPLAEKQIQEYIDVDMPIEDYWDYREGLNDLAPLPGKKSVTLEQQADYIDGLDLPVSKKNILINNLTDRKTPIDMTSYGDYDSLDEFDYATKNPDKYALAKSVGGYSAYKTYSDELYDIKADKDSSGKSISGSRKEKVIDYLNNLNADYYTKIILLKSEYPSDDTYNGEIVNYINSRSDLSYDEKVAVLTELGFRVSADGQIYDD